MDPKSKDEDGAGGTKSPEGISNCDSLEMEIGSGHQVKLDEEVFGAVGGSGGQVKPGDLEGKENDDADSLELEKLIKGLQMEGDPQGTVLKGELLSKLEVARVEAADREKALRRMKWKEEVRVELLIREELRRQMESVPLSKVTNGKAKADMSRMSMRWRDALKRGRTRFFFDEVFPILFGATSVESQGNLVRTCRSVSRLWKESTEDSILPRFEGAITEWDSWRVLGPYSLQICATRFSDKRNLAYFNRWSEHRYSGRNPFFSRRLAFAGGSAEWKNNLEFWRQGELLLRRWGQEIWVFMIRFDKWMAFEVMYEQLRKYLKLMPNLRSLTIMDSPRRGSNSMPVTDMTRDLAKDIYGPLRARIARNPLPELPHLKYLLIRDCVVAPLVQALLAGYSGQLELVTMNDTAEGERVDPIALLTERDLKLPRLRLAAVTSFAPPGIFDFNTSWSSLVTFSLNQPHLTGAEDVLTIFQNLNRLRPISTLRRLCLTLQPVIKGPSPMLKLSDEQSRSLFLELPQLEAFEVGVIHVNFNNIDFLLPCASLKELGLTYHRVQSIMPKDEKVSMSDGKGMKSSEDADDAATASPHEIIQFFEYTNRLHESNLWKLFPELKMVSLEVQTLGYTWGEFGARNMGVVSTKTKLYSREGYMNYLGSRRMDPNQKDEVVVEEATSKEAGACASTSDSLEMEMGSESGHQVKLVEAGACSVEGSEGQVKTMELDEGKDNDESMLELEKLVKDFNLKGDPQGKGVEAYLLSNLEGARIETAAQRKAARRIKWKEEVQMEMLKREEFKRQMASTPLGKVKDWKAKAGMSKMSVEWRKAFKNKRTSFLFHEVFPILFENVPTESGNELVLTCRPISKDWKGSAESYILSKYQKGSNVDEFGTQPGDYTTICGLQFNRKTEMSVFNYWSQHRYLGNNPFFSRRLSFAGGNAEWRNNLEFWREGEVLLRRWGQEIWTFVIEFDKGMTFEVMYEQLVKYLKLMPNLRSLCIMDHPRSAENSALTDVYDRLTARIARNPLPELPHLKYLQFQNCIVPPLATAALAKYSVSVEYVMMRGSEEGPDPRGVLTGKDLQLPHLKVMFVASFAPPGAFDIRLSFPALKVFLLMQLDMKGPEDVLAAFGNLNRLKPISTLRRVALEMRPATTVPMIRLTDEQLKGLLLELPQLEHFSLYFGDIDVKNIDFILPCVSLKEFEIDYRKVEIRNLKKDKKTSSGKGKKRKGRDHATQSAAPLPLPPPDEIIQFTQYKNELYKSNLWKLLPELNRVCFSVTTSSWVWEEGKPTDQGVIQTDTKLYSREGYKEHLGGRGNSATN